MTWATIRSATTMILKTSKLVSLILLFFALASCDSWVHLEQGAISQFVVLEPGHNAGQTFKANYAGLKGVAVELQSEDSLAGFLEFRLLTRENGGEIKANSSLDLSTKPVQRTNIFQFPPLPDSNQAGYLLEIENTGTEEIPLGIAGGKSYLHGSFYQDTIPQDAQLSFSLIYDPLQAVRGLLAEIVRWLFLLFIGALLWIAPGWIILGIFVNSWSRFHWGEKLGFALGLSLSIYPIIFLWTGIFNLRLGALNAWIPLLISISLLLWFRRKSIFPLRLPKVANAGLFGWSEIVFILVVLLVFFVRFWVVRSLDTPLWGDGYQHSLITQLILDNGGLFSNWLPYADLHTFTYHFGFHANAANFSWATGLQSEQAVLWFGQIVNGMVVLALFPLGMRMKRNAWSGILAVLFAGLLFSMPMFFVNWSRYTQLTGLTILASFTGFVWIFLTRKKFNLPALAISSILLAGLALTHYRVLIFAMIFLIIFLIFYLRSVGLSTLAKNVFALGILSFVIYIPWFVNIFAGKLLDILGYQISTPSGQLVSSQESAVGIGNLFSYLPPLAWISLPFLIGWAFWRKNKAVALICAWWFTIFLAANPQWLRLPGVGTITSFAVLISAFFPISLILSEGITWLIIRASSSIQQFVPGNTNNAVNMRMWINPVFSILIVGAALWGVSERRHDLSEFEHALVTRPDIYASAWINDYLPEQSTNLVNSFFAYGGSLIAGSDGGWWLPLLANRSTTLPPLNYGAEQGPFPEYAAWVNALTATIEKQGINDPEVLSMLRERGITHVYLGQRQGEVGTPDPLLDVNLLNASDHYRPVYHQDRVWVFQIQTGE